VKIANVSVLPFAQYTKFIKNLKKKNAPKKNKNNNPALKVE
jgi:hypothetical protein